MSAFTAIIKGSSRPTNYQTLPTEDDRSAVSSTRHEGDGDGSSGGRRHEPAVYLSFWLFGAGTLLGWSALMCTFPLLVSFYPADSRIGQNLPSILSTLYCFGQLVFLGQAQRQVGLISPTGRIRWGLLGLIATFGLTTFPLLPLILPSLSTTLLLPILLLVVFCLNVSGSYFQSAALALASLWGSTEILAALSGQGGIAVLISLVQVILAFIAALGTSTSTPEGEGEGGDEAPSMLAGVGLWLLGTFGAGLCWLAFRYLVQHPSYDKITAIAKRHGDDEDVRVGSVGSESGDKKTEAIFGKNKWLYLAVALDFAVTLSVFPAITSLITSTHSPTPRLLKADVFIPLHFFIFNAGDYIGRTYLPSVPALLITSHPRILLLSAARILFVPLFLACNLSTTASGGWINSDIIYFVILIMFGVTNGYIGSISIIVSSTPALNPALAEDEKDVAGTLGVFCLMAGLTMGSMASFGVNHAVRG